MMSRPFVVIFFFVAILLASTSSRAGEAPPPALRLTLSEAIDRAVRENEGLKANHEDVKIASGEKLSSFQAVLPTVKGSASYERNLNKSVIFFPNTVTGQIEKVELGEDNSTDLRFTVTQPLFDFGGMAFALKSSGLAYEASRAAFENEKNDLIYKTTLAYYRLELLREKADLEQLSYEKNKTALVQTNSKRSQGLLRRYDLLKAELALKESEVAHLAADQAEADGENTLRNLLKIDKNTPIELADSIALPPPPPADFNLVLKKSVERNPFLKQLHLTTDSLKWALRQKETTWAPRLDGTFTYAKSAESSSFPPDDGDFATTESAGVLLSFPIFDGLKREGEIKSAKARYMKALYEMRQSMKDFTDELEKAHRQVTLTRLQYEASEEAAALAVEALREANLRKKEGLLTELQLKESEVASREQAVKKIEATWNALSASAYLEKLVGGK